MEVRPLVESVNILAGTEDLPLDVAFSAWADKVLAEQPQSKSKKEEK